MARFAPTELIRYQQWVNWRYVDRAGKATKVPYQPSGEYAKVNDPETFSSFVEVDTASGYDGIGFVVHKVDPFCAVDIDHCISDGKLLPEAQAIVDALNSYTEITPSGIGVRVWVQAELPDHKGRKVTLRGFDLEVYDNLRFLTVTGNVVGLYPETIEERQAEVDALLVAYFKEEDEAAPSGTSPSLDDQVVLEKMFAAANGESCKALWHGDISAYGDDDSRADYALALKLAFWTQDAAQIERLMRQSCLARPKWDKHRSYLSRTIDDAVRSKRETYSGSAISPPVPADDSKLKATEWLLAHFIANSELFRTTDGETFIRFPDNQHTYPIRSGAFRQYVRNLYWERRNKTVGDDALKRVVDTLDAQAASSGKRTKAYMRVAPDGKGGIYIDLRNDSYEAVHVTKDGWKVVNDYPVLFKRGRNSCPMVTPENGDVDTLRTYLNVDERQWMMLASCLVSYLHPSGPYPVLSITGEQGSGKSTVCKIIKRLIDPAVAELYSMPLAARDVMTSAVNNWLLAYENLSGMPPWLSDILCCLSTGAGHATRELYTDMDEKVLNAKRPVITNGIPDIVTRPDLLSRSIVLELGPMVSYRTESEFEEAFNQDLPRIFGGLLTVLSGALRRLGKTMTDKSARMADFVALASAAAEDFGWTPTEFLVCYSEARLEAEDVALEGSPVALSLQAFVGAQPEQRWEGTAGELLSHITPDRPGKTWPRTASTLANVIRRYAPALRQQGLHITFNRSHNARVITLIKSTPVFPGFELPQPEEIPPPAPVLAEEPAAPPVPEVVPGPQLKPKAQQQLREEQMMLLESRINRLLDEGRITQAEAEDKLTYIYRWRSSTPDNNIRACSVCGEVLFWSSADGTHCISCYPPAAGVALKLALAN